MIAFVTEQGNQGREQPQATIITLALVVNATQTLHSPAQQEKNKHVVVRHHDIKHPDSGKLQATVRKIPQMDIDMKA